MSDSPIKIKSTSISFGTGKSAGGGREAQGASSRGPLRIVALSMLAARAAHSARATPDARPIAIDKLSFDKVMAQLAPTFAIAVDDPFAPGGAPLEIELRFADLKSMRADAIVEQVSVLRALVEARRIVAKVKERRISADDARAQLTRVLPRAHWAEALTAEVGTKPAASAPPAAASAASKGDAPAGSKSDALDRLFEQVAVKGSADDGEESAPERAEAPAAPAAFSAIVAAVARGGRERHAREHAPAVVGSAPERVERAFARVLGDLLRHPEVRRIERAWRGLRMLVDGCDTRAGVELDVVPVDKEDVADALRALAEPGADASRAPVDVFLVDHEVGANEADIALLASWARAARDAHAPVVVNGHPRLLGLASIDELPKAAKRLGGFDDPRPPEARDASADDGLRWAAVAMNGLLVRAAYTPSSSRLRELPFAEDAKDLASHVFAGPALGVGILCAQSYARTGWPTAIVGAREGAVQNLAVREVDDAFGGASFAIPLEAFVGDDVVREAARAGVMLFASAANHDAAILARAPVFHKKGAAAPQTTLGDQLFVGRFANAVQQVAAALPPDVDANSGAEAAEIALAELFLDAGPAGPEVRARVGGGRLEVTVRPRRYAGVSLDEITLAAPLG